MAEKILLIDDDMDTLRLVGVMLQRQGYEVKVANSGQQALSIVQSELPDLILLDIMMPEMDGYEVARRLRSDTITSNIPIIISTAKSQVDDKVMGFESGADDYLTKPTQPRELFAHIKAVLARSGKPRDDDGPAPSEPGYLVGILAAKGGLGVSTIALNLGVTLHDSFKKEVIVADYRPGQGTIALELGLESSDGLIRLLQAKPTELTLRKVESELVNHALGIRLLLSSSIPADARFIDAHASYEKITKQLIQLARYVILDLGPSLPPITESVSKLCDELVIIVEPVPQNVLQSRNLISDLSRTFTTEKKITVALVNRIRSGVHLSWSEVQEQLGHPISVIFTPAPEPAYHASISNQPIVMYQTDGLSAQQFTKLAERVVKYTQ